MTELARLNVFIGADAKQLTKALDKASDRIQKVGRKMQDVGRKMTTGLTAPLAAAGVAATAMAVRMGNAADKLLDMEQQTGLTTTALQEFRRVATVAGVETDVLSRAAEQMTLRMSRGAEGSADLRAGLAELGLSATDAAGNLRPMEQVVNEALSALADMEDITTRNVLATKLFSRGARELAPVLGMGSAAIREAREEAHEMGLVLSRDALVAANEFRVEMDTLQDRFKALADQLGIAVIPAITDLVRVIEDKVVPAARSMIDWIRGIDPETRRAIVAFGLVAAAAGPLVFALGGIVVVGGKVLGVVAGVAAALGTGLLPLIAVGGAIIVGLTLLATKFVAAGLKAAEARREMEKFTESLETMSSEKLQATMDQLVAKRNELQRELRKQEGFLELNLPETTLVQVRRRVATLRQQLGELQQSAIETQRAMDALGSGSEPTETPKPRGIAIPGIGGVHEGLLALREIPPLIDGVVMPALDGFASKVADVAEEFSNLGALTQQVLREGVFYAGAFADTLVSAATEGMAAFQRFAESLLKDLARILARFLIFKALTSLFPGSSFVGAVGQSFGFRASGGPVSAARPYIVGERGPELFVPSSSGNVVPNDALGGGVTVNLDVSRLPRPSDPRQAARDNDWLRFLAESFDGLKAAGVTG